MTVMLFKACCILLGGLLLVRADWWDDFSNNLATDLAPLLSLFGEKVTMQYLSESITFLDYFIFAMAPMGILTALVSAIRVCGSPSLRAFIGRAQEGAGNAEAELCSSTSRNVCELYNNGGIARVFGRPKILEVIHDPSDPNFSETAGIYTFKDYVKTNNGKAFWKEQGARTDMESQNEDNDSGPFAPNLSLNVGIRRKSDAVFLGVAILGAVLQIGVLIYAGIITYYLQWESENNGSVEYACPLTIIGTLLVCSGVFYCAFLVGESTTEQVYCRTSSNDGSRQQGDTRPSVPSLYWLQPGGQVLGDQTFDAFCYSDREQPLPKYLISWKRRSEAKKPEIWAAVSMTTIGFVMQFIGLRGIHATAAVAQLGAIIVMSAARASLRMQRLKPRDNFLVDCPDEVVGYELDWLALRIGRNDIEDESSEMQQSAAHSPADDRRESWKFCGTSKHIASDTRPSQELNAAAKLLAYRTRLAELTDSPATGPDQASSSRQFRDEMVKVKSVAKQLTQALEDVASMIYLGAFGVKLADADILWWELNCSVATRFESSSHQTDSASSEISPLHVGLHHFGEDRLVFQKPLEVEAILGLWLWSLVSDFSTETRDKYDHVRISRASEVPTRRIISTREEVQDLELWTGTEFHTNDETFAYKDVEFARPSDIFILKQNDSSTYEPLTSNLPRDLGAQDNPRVARYFGWHNIEASQTQNVDFSSDGLKLCTTNSGSLISCCAQEIFGSFFKSLLAGVTSVGRVAVEEGPRGLFLSSSMLKDITEAFVRNGLGSNEEEALSYILPSMRNQLQSAPIEVALQMAIEALKRNQIAKHWQSAEAIMRWAWSICKQPPEEVEDHAKDYARLSAMALGELYRSASMDNTSMEFGEVGITWLLDESYDQSDTCCKSIQCYRGFLDGIDSLHTVEHLPRIEDNQDSTAALLYISQRLPSMARVQKGEALYSAVRRGWVEVVLALLVSGADPDHEGMGSRPALFYAAEEGFADIVNILIEWGASQYHFYPELPIVSAVRGGHYLVVKSLLDTFDPVRVWKRDGRTALHVAAESSHKVIPQLLIDSKKFDFESKDEQGNTPLHLAAERGREATVELLINSHRASIEIVNNEGYTPLHLAIRSGHAAIVKLIFDMYQVDPESQNIDGVTLLHFAAGEGAESVVRLLIGTYHVDPESRDSTERTPLHCAASRGEQKVVKVLLDTYHVDPESRDFDGDTPLHHAAQYGTGSIIRFLIDTYHLDPESRNNIGGTPLHQAASRYGQEIVELLLDTYHVDLESRDDQGRTPLHLAAKHGEKSTVKLFIDTYHAHRESRDKTGRTPLHYAASRYGQEMVELLLDTYHVNPKSRDVQGMTPLHLAVQFGDKRTIEYLLNSIFVDRESRDETGRTPLHLAMETPWSYTSFEITRLLVNTYNVNPDIEDRDGRTPLDYAVAAGNSDKVNFMLDVSSEENQAKAFRYAVENGYDEIVKVFNMKSARFPEEKNDAGELANGLLDVNGSLVSTD